MTAARFFCARRLPALSLILLLSCGDEGAGLADPESSKAISALGNEAGYPGYCSDGECNPYLGEDCESCPEDCGGCPYDGGPYDGGAPEGGPLEAGPDGGGVDAGGGGGPDGDGCTSDSECDDGDFRNGEEACVDGECQSAKPPDCDDDKVCTLDYCDEAAEMCVNAFQRGLCTCDANTAVPDITYSIDKD